MKKLFLASVALVAVNVGSSALAADLAVKARPLPPPVPRCAQFGGFYIGGNVGAGFYSHSADDQDDFVRGVVGVADDHLSGNIHANKSGFIGGVQGGYNWQWNCTMFGIEADYNWGRITASGFNTDGRPGEDLDTISFSSQLRAIGTIRARAGFVLDNVLLYVTGGLAYANFRREIIGNNIDDAEIDIFQSSRTRWGWATGFGAEWAISGWGKAPVGGGNWSIKWETLYHHFDTDEQTFTCVQNCARDRPVRFAFQDSVWTTKIGLNYRFDWGKYPVAARY